jgi:hypothetical protein
MKKYPIRFKLLIISALASASLSFPGILPAQGSADRVFYASFTSESRSLAGPKLLRLNEIPGVASRHLLKNYQQTASVSWSRKPGGFIATLNQAGRVFQVNYDQAGNFQYSVRFMEMEDLGEKLLRQIKKEYPSFTFDIIAEVKNEVRTQIIVTLKNEYLMKSLMIRDGQIQVIDQLDYASR